MESTNAEGQVNHTPSESIVLRLPNPYSSPNQHQDGQPGALFASVDQKRGIIKVPAPQITPHQTLGQIAEKIQEEARAAARSRGEDFDEEVFDQQDGDEDDGDDQDDDEDDDEQGQQGVESTGRWTRQEHDLFLEGLKRFGKEWKKVASMVKTRTVVQTRTHAQKYFQKLAKHTGSDVEGFSSVEKSGHGGSERKSALSSHKKSRRSESPPEPPSSSDVIRIPARRTTFVDTPMKAPEVSYYPLDTEQLQPYEPITTPTNSEFPFLSLPPPKIDFPAPSPAACGKRKHIELKAAQILASGGASSAPIDIESAKLLSKMKEESIERSVNSGKRFRSSELSLSIMNPEGLLMTDVVEPGTPWDKEITALAAKSSSQRDETSRMIQVSTPSEQRKFVEKIRSLIKAADQQGLMDIFQAVEAKAARELEVDSNSESADAAHDNKSFTTNHHELIGKSLNLVKDNQISLVMEALQIDATKHSSNTINDICKLLIDYGASVTFANADGNTALHYAAMFGNERVGKLLLAKGCPVNATNHDGDAAVHLAAKAGHGPFLEMLASLGANFHLRNGNALSPMDLAGYNSKDPGEREVLRRLMLSAEPRLRTLILYHQDFLEHTARRAMDWEGPDRLRNIMSRLRDRKEFPEYELEVSSQFDKADVELLGRVHCPEYLAFVNDLSKQVKSNNEGVAFPAPVPFTPQVQKHIMRQPSTELKLAENCDTSFSSGTLNAARRAAGAVAHAVDRVMLGRNRNVFCAVRPPGHHAGYRGLLDGADSCGFCIFNNVAAGALHALTEHQCERVAIIDLDVHHGNGTEDIVRRYQHPSRLFFFSLHLFDKEPTIKYQFYPGTGSVDDHVHNVINVPIAPLWRGPQVSSSGRERRSSSKQQAADQAAENGTSHFTHPADKLLHASSNTPPPPLESPPSRQQPKLYGREAYRQAITQRLIPSLRAFNPDLILLSTGFDAAAGDVGNCRHVANSAPIRGMDLSPEDFAWATTEVMKIADICCSGRLVSVLEGGYGEYDHHSPTTRQKTYSTRSGGVKEEVSDEHNTKALVEIDANAMESFMNRGILAEAASAHVHRLIDPYGPNRLLNAGTSFHS